MQASLTFATLGVPQQLKTDNGPACVSQKTQEFLQLWGIRHSTGIPHSPTGQTTVEYAHCSLKAMLLKQKGGVGNLSAQEKLAKATYVLNFLNCWSDAGGPPIFRHFLSTYQKRPEIRDTGP